MKGSDSSGDYSQAIINSLEDELMVIDRDYRIIQAREVQARSGREILL